MKIVLLIALISSPPSDLWPHFKLCAKQVVMELGQPLSEKPLYGERLKMVRTADLP
jgi:hypothetical protein